MSAAAAALLCNLIKFFCVCAEQSRLHSRIRRKIKSLPDILVCRGSEISRSCKQSISLLSLCVCVCVFETAAIRESENQSLPGMCPGKRSFWTSPAVSPFQGQSREQRWLSLFDFGKTSFLLSGNFSQGKPVWSVLVQLEWSAKRKKPLRKLPNNQSAQEPGWHKKQKSPQKFKQPPQNTGAPSDVRGWSRSSGRKRAIEGPSLSAVSQFSQHCPECVQQWHSDTPCGTADWDLTLPCSASRDLYWWWMAETHYCTSKTPLQAHFFSFSFLFSFSLKRLLGNSFTTQTI